MNIVGANSSRGGHYPSQSVVYGGEIKASTLVTTVDPPQRYKKGIGEGNPSSLRPTNLPTLRMDLGLAKQFHTGETPVSSGGNF